MHAAFPSSRYALHLRRWLQVFPHESILLLRFDEVSSKIHRYYPNQPDACKSLPACDPRLCCSPLTCCSVWRPSFSCRPSPPTL